MQGRLFISISDFQGCHYWCLPFLFQLWIYLTVVFLIVISNCPVLHAYCICIGLSNSWIRIQNNSRSTDKGWEADMKSSSWGMNVSISLYTEQSTCQESTYHFGRVSESSCHKQGGLSSWRGRWREGFSCCPFPMDVEGAIKGEMRRKLLFMTLKKNGLVHWDESEAFWKVCVVIWGGKKYKWR